MAEVVTIGEATLYHGDCVEILPSIDVGVVISDPPYGISFSHGGADVKGIGGGKYRSNFPKEKIVGDDQKFNPAHLLALGVPCLLWGANHYADLLPASADWLIWDKREAESTLNFADCEMAWTNAGGNARIYRHYWNGMLKASERGESRVHPTQKPIALMERCISYLGGTGTVVDPYMGSGTTGVACARLGRRFVGIEIERKYFDISCQRIDAAYSQGRLFA